MLKNLIYFNETSLDSYLASLEDGLRNSAESRDTTRERKGGFDVKVVNLGGENDQGAEEKISRNRTPRQRVQSLLDSSKTALERKLTHDRYLKGSPFCGECGPRMQCGVARSKQGNHYT